MKHKNTASNFVQNIQRAMRVSGESEVNYPCPISQTELSKLAGVSRSTLAHHKELDANKERAPNPTLEKICSIAESLNVPPAFLLMRPEDWTRFAQAIEYYGSLRESGKYHPILHKLDDLNKMSTDEQASLAFQYAKCIEIDGQPNIGFLNELEDESKKKFLDAAHLTRKSIYANSVLPPIKKNEQEGKSCIIHRKRNIWRSQ